MRILAGIARPGIGPGAAFVVGGAGGGAGFITVAAFKIEILVVAAEAVDRGFDRIVLRFDHAGAADAGDAATILDPRRHAALEPAHRTTGRIGRIVEAPGPATLVAFAGQRAIGRVAGGDRRTLIVAARPVEIGLCRGVPRRRERRHKGERHQTRPEQATYPHAIASEYARSELAFERPQPVRRMNGPIMRQKQLIQSVFKRSGYRFA